MSVLRNSFREFIYRSRISLLAALFAVLMTPALRAQIVETGVITGAVHDNTGAIIEKAQVSVRNDSTGLTTKTATDAQGIFVSPPLHPGDYSVEIEAPDFELPSSTFGWKLVNAYPPMSL